MGFESRGHVGKMWIKMLGFRVWDAERKLMVSKYSKDCFMINMFGVMYDGEPGDEDNPDEPLTVSDERFIPMQSTGLLDCTGKEIFKGDILLDPITSKYIQVKNILGFIMDYGTRGFDLIDAEGVYQERFIISCESAYIIGNKYENPELLEKLNARI